MHATPQNQVKSYHKVKLIRVAIDDVEAETKFEKAIDDFLKTDNIDVLGIHYQATISATPSYTALIDYKQIVFPTIND